MKTQNPSEHPSSRDIPEEEKKIPAEPKVPREGRPETEEEYHDRMDPPVDIQDEGYEEATDRQLPP
jgi:hypothetical protein